jgi:hypothetical protein
MFERYNRTSAIHSLYVHRAGRISTILQRRLLVLAWLLIPRPTSLSDVKMKPLSMLSR